MNERSDIISLSLVQMGSIIGDPESNCRKIIDIIGSSDSDIICFPEASLTGYTSIGLEKYALRRDDPLIGMICGASSEKRIVTVFGFIEKEGEKTMVTQAVTENGNVSFYRKTHLGHSEKKVFTPGDTIEPILTGKGNIGIELCWESHFPEISALLALKGAKIILMPFASPLNAKKRVRIWKKYLPARAYDNRVFVAACNLVDGERGGGAMVIDKEGNILKENTEQCENILSVDIDLSCGYGSVNTMHGRDFLASRRPELYDL
jgi:predicted amidohydrolase